MIYVDGDDYAALEFEKYFKGKSVKEIIERFFEGDEEYDGDFDMGLYEFKNIDPEFISFIRNEISDYDQSKHSNFYFEDAVIR